MQTELQALLPEIMASPRLYLHTLDLDKNAALVIDTGPDFYRNAIFLDQRILAPDTRGAWFPLDVLWQHMDAMAGRGLAPAHFIFHTGHCGSTLISRLLDEIPSVLGLREPLVLRTLAAGLHDRAARPGQTFDEVFRRACQLLVRRFAQQQHVVIKATSMCNNLAAVLLVQNPANRGILLFVTLEVYLANMLDKTDNADVDAFLEHRFTCLERVVPDLELDIRALSRPEKIAFSWFADAAQFYQLSKANLNERVLLMDFDRFLAQTDTHLLRIFQHFAISAGQEILGKMLAGSVFKTYSKQPDFAFSAANREAILNESRADNQPAIKQGIRFAERLMKNHPDLGEMTDTIPLG